MNAMRQSRGDADVAGDHNGSQDDNETSALDSDHKLQPLTASSPWSSKSSGNECFYFYFPILFFLKLNNQIISYLSKTELDYFLSYSLLSCSLYLLCYLLVYSGICRSQRKRADVIPWHRT